MNVKERAYLRVCEFKIEAWNPLSHIVLFNCSALLISMKFDSG
jgi:hypothetical protein